MLPDLLDDIEKIPTVQSIGISCTSLNDVYLKANSPGDQGGPISIHRAPAAERDSLVDRSTRARSAFSMLLWKHWLNFVRRWHSLVATLGVPTFFIVLSVGLLGTLSTKQRIKATTLGADDIAAASKPVLLFPGDLTTLELAQLERAIKGAVDPEPVFLPPFWSWQYCILNGTESAYASCGNPKQTLTCASLIVDPGDLPQIDVFGRVLRIPEL